MIFQFLLIFAVFQAVSTRGFRSEKEFYLDDFPEVSGKSLSPISDPNVLEKGKQGQETKLKGSHHPVEQEQDKRRKFLNGRKTGNVSLEYQTTGKENGTWNVEKKEKDFDLGKEVFKTCQVTTEELVATAQATVTRALEGLCSSKEIEERFDDLETSIATQFNTIRQMIHNLGESLADHGDLIMHGQKQLSVAISKVYSESGNGNGGFITNLQDFKNKNQKQPHDYSGTKVSSNGKDAHGSDEEDDVSGARDPEILKFNSSIHMETGLNGVPKKVFTYYWKIKDMTFKLTGWNPRKSLRSQSFYIFPSGYRMYMRIFPRKNEDNFYVRVGVTKGEFDDTLKWPFPLKHKIHILDQTKEGRVFEDIASRIWDPNLLCSDFNWQKPIKGDNHECVEVGFPHDILNQREYIQKDALVIKLTVYLES